MRLDKTTVSKINPIDLHQIERKCRFCIMQDVIAQIKSNPDLLSESLDEIVKKDPQLLKQLLLQVLPHIIDKMEQQNEIVGGAPREKRGLWIQDDVKPQSRTCNTLAKINSYYQIFIKIQFLS